MRVSQYKKINVTLTLEIRSHRTIGLRFFYKTYIMTDKEGILFLTDLINQLRIERDSLKEEVYYLRDEIYIMLDEINIMLDEINEQKKLN